MYINFINIGFFFYLNIKNIITIITIKKQKNSIGAIINMFSFRVLLGFCFVEDLHIAVKRVWGLTSHITISLT